MLTQQERIKRQRIVDNALANQRLEGLTPDARTVADAQAFVRGELEVADIIYRLRCRVEDEVRK